MSEETQPGRRGGAQPGNKNALKHGFYAKQYVTEETDRLDDSDRLSLEDELDLLRVFVDRLSGKIKLDDELTQTELSALNTLAIMMQARATLVRTHYLTRGKGGALEQTIMEALDEIRLEMGL